MGTRYYLSPYNFQAVINMCTKERIIFKFDEKTNRYQQVLISCGKCFECLQKRRTSWQVRTEKETISNGVPRYKHAYLLTLTYDNPHLNFSSNGKMSLRIKDLQMFIDRLRKEYPFRYLCCGEYGGKYHRPHYHLLVLSNNDKPLTRVQVVRKWHNGFVDFKVIKNNKTDFQKISCYIAKYISKGACDAPDVISFSKYRQTLKDFLPYELRHVRKPENYLNEIRAYYPTLRETRINRITKHMEECSNIIKCRHDFPSDELYGDPTQFTSIYMSPSDLSKLFIDFNPYAHWSYLYDIRAMYEVYDTFDSMFAAHWESYEAPFVRASQNWGYNESDYIAVDNIPFSDIPLSEFLPLSTTDNPYEDYLQQSYTQDNINLLKALVTYEQPISKTQSVRLALPSYLRNKIIDRFPYFEAAVRSLTTQAQTDSVQRFKEKYRELSLTIPASQINAVIDELRNQQDRKATAKYRQKISCAIQFGIES